MILDFLIKKHNCTFFLLILLFLNQNSALQWLAAYVQNSKRKVSIETITWFILSRENVHIRNNEHGKQSSQISVVKRTSLVLTFSLKFKGEKLIF